MEPLQKQCLGIVKLFKNPVLEYDWGNQSPNCLIGQLTKEPHTKYAELWMGTHHRGPSMLNQQTSLSQYLSSVGKKQLTFLFKILNISKCLSIQLHPNKNQAEKLHEFNPQLYGDVNDKPEMFYTLSQFECFLGVLEEPQWRKMMQIRPFCSLQSSSEYNPPKTFLELLSLPSEQLPTLLQALLKDQDALFPERVDILKRLSTNFPNDLGVLASALLQYFILPAGSCMTINPGVPHAYISGDVIEIMRNSDNVIRLGLTNKVKDVHSMVDVLTKGGPELIQKQVNHVGDQVYVWNGLFIRLLCSDKEGPTERIVYFGEDSTAIVASGSFTINCKDNATIHAEAGTVMYIHAGSYHFSGIGTLYCGGSRQ